MKTVNSIFLKSLIAGTGFSIAILITGMVYAAISHVAIGDKLESTTFNNVIDAIVPTGAVMSFNLVNCPTGWTEYTPARGRFIRGIDSTGTNDTLNRSLGDLQEDDLKSHTHKLTNSNNLGYMYDNFANVNGFGVVNGGRVSISRAKNYYTLGTGGSETRPKNVSLLYCQKN